jgi:hypothetical protein
VEEEDVAGCLGLANGVCRLASEPGHEHGQIIGDEQRNESADEAAAMLHDVGTQRCDEIAHGVG